MTQSIRIDGLTFPVRLGCCEEERSFPQKVKANILMHGNFEKCLRSDRLEDTIDYLAVARDIETLARDHSWKLLEKLAFDIGQHLLGRFEGLEEVQITVQKNILRNAEGFSATISCRRE